MLEQRFRRISLRSHLAHTLPRDPQFQGEKIVWLSPVNVSELGHREKILAFLFFQLHNQTMKGQMQFFLLTGWLIPIGVALVFFGRWITEIVIPTLKGGSFDQLYDLHRVRYLDTPLACTALAFAWIAVAVIRCARTQAGAR